MSRSSRPTSGGKGRKRARAWPGPVQASAVSIEIYCDDGHTRISVQEFAYRPAVAYREWRLLRSDRRDAEHRVDGGGLVDVRYRLSCRTCKRTVPVRAEKLWPVLDVLRQAGVPDITLTGLAARLVANRS